MPSKYNLMHLYKKKMVKNCPKNYFKPRKNFIIYIPND